MAVAPSPNPIVAIVLVLDTRGVRGLADAGLDGTDTVIAGVWN